MTKYNDLTTVAQQFGLGHKFHQNLTPSGWKRKYTETTNEDYRDKMETLRTQDQHMRDIFMGKNGDESFKSMLGLANQAFKADRYLDVAYWLNKLSKGINSMLTEGAKVEDLTSDELNKSYTNQQEDGVDDLFQAADGLISNAGIMDFLGKMFGGGLEKMYKEKVRKRKLAVQSLLGSADLLLSSLIQSFDRMGSARASGNIGAWITDFNKMQKDFDKFYVNFKTIYNTHLKELADLAKKQREEQQAEADKFKAKNKKVDPVTQETVEPAVESVVPVVEPTVKPEEELVVHEDNFVPEPVAEVEPEVIEEVAPEAVVKEEFTPEVKSRPPTDEEKEESARRQSIQPEATEEEMVNKLMELIRNHPSRKQEFIDKYHAGDLSFLNEDEGVAVEELPEEIIEKQVEPVVEDVVSEPEEELTAEEPVIEEEPTVEEESVVENIEEPITYSPEEPVDEPIDEPADDEEFGFEPEEKKSEGGNITLVILPKGGIDDMESEKAKLEAQLGTEIAFVTEQSAEMVGDNYIDDGFNVDVKSYKELTANQSKSATKASLKDLDDPEFISKLKRLGNGKLWVGSIMDEVFDHLPKREQDAVRAKLIELNNSTQPEVTSNPVTTELTDEQKIENHTKALEAVFDKSIKDIVENPFDLLNNVDYIKLLPTKDDDKLDMDLISKFPEAIAGGAFFLSTLSRDKTKKDLLNTVMRLNKKSHVKEHLKIVNAAFIESLIGVIDDRDCIKKLCAHSELIDAVDPDFSVKLLQQAWKLSNG